MEVLIKQETASRKSGATSSVVLPSAPSESIVMGSGGGDGSRTCGSESVAEADMIFSTSTGTCTVHVR